MLNLLDAVRDESGKDAAVRLVFEPKTSRVDRDEFVNTLLAQTSMESSPRSTWSASAPTAVRARRACATS